MLSNAMRICAVFIFGIAVAGCHSKSDPTKENFSAAVQNHLDGTDAVCVFTGAVPFDLPDVQDLPRRRADLLVKVGLLATQPTSLTVGIRTVPAFRYTLTDEGKKAYRALNPAPDSRLCGGKAKLVEITWSSSVEKADVGTSVDVKYVGKLIDRPHWDDEAILRPLFPEMLSTTNDQFNNENILTLTKDGWAVTR
jgi:hypothetical protein